MIVKVQRSLYSTQGDSCLIYNEDRSVMWEGRTPDSIRSLMGRANKMFFYADLVKGTLIITTEAPWQEW